MCGLLRDRNLVCNVQIKNKIESVVGKRVHDGAPKMYRVLAFHVLWGDRLAASTI